MEIATFVATMLLASAAFWYTFETRQLRIQAANQLTVLRHQTRLSIVPSIFPAVWNYGLENIKQRIEREYKNDPVELAAKLQRMEHSPLKALCTAHNPSDRLAYQVNLFMYNDSTKSFLIANSSHEFVGGKESKVLEVPETFFDLDGVVQWLREQYGTDCETILPHVKARETSFVALLFRDLEGERVYLNWRPFEVSSSGLVSHQASKLVVGD